MKQDLKSIVINFIPAFLATLAVVFLQYHSGWFEQLDKQPVFYSYFTNACYILILFSSFCFLNSIYKIIKIQFEPQKYFREHFSLIAFNACFWLTLILLISFVIKLMPWHLCVILASYVIKNEIPQVVVPIAEYIAVTFGLIIVSFWLSTLHQKWNGKTSTKQHEKEQSSQDSSFIDEGIGELLRIVIRQEHLEVYVNEKRFYRTYYVKLTNKVPS